MVILEAPESRQVKHKRIKEEHVQTDSAGSCVGGERQSERLKEDGGDSQSANRTLDEEAVDRNLELFPASCSSDVVCTRGQKWLVEEL
jgi:hypothetical protein